MADVSNISNNQSFSNSIKNPGMDAEAKNIAGITDGGGRLIIDPIGEAERKEKERKAGEEQKAIDEANAKLDEIAKLMTEGEGTLRPSVLNRIIRLLKDLIPILQHVGTAQAKLLDLPTKMQAMYTDLIAKAPIYTKDGSHGTTKIDDDEDRQSKTAEVQAYTDNLRSYRDYWSDTAKKLQSNINTTNEAVNQQVDLMTTFFQQLRELVSLITR